MATREALQPSTSAEETVSEPLKKTTSGDKAQPYSEVVERLEDVVKKLENGQLSLEDTLAEFEKGIRLVQRGEELLAQADKRVQELLEHEGQERAVPLDAKASAASTRPAARASGDDEDIPF